MQGNKKSSERLRDAHSNHRSLRMLYQAVLLSEDHRLDSNHHLRNKKKHFRHPKFINLQIITQQFRRSSQSLDRLGVYLEVVKLPVAKKSSILLIRVFIERKNSYRLIIRTILKREAILRYT